ncbi:hypothetical protein OROGR_030215 [Orobanche gracilis]
MDIENVFDVNLTDLDLNQEPVYPRLHSVTVESLLSELDTAQQLVEQRIQQLQEWNSVEISPSSSEMMVNVNSNQNRSTLDGINSIAVVESTADHGKCCRGDSSHLIAKALDINSEVKKSGWEGGGFYDCNICLDMAKEPVLTCCGHLFCWPCFYQVSNVDSTSKECPVCMGEVSESTVIPIYGDGGNERVSGIEEIPPRPKAPRVESIRQQISNVPVDEALRRISAGLGVMGYQTQQEEEGGNGNDQVSRVVSESVASVSSVLSSVGRLVEELQMVISSPMSRNDRQTPLAAIGNPLDAASQSTDVSGSDVRILWRRISSGTSMPMALPYSLRGRRRRSFVSRNSDGDSPDTRRSVWRRLN